MDRYKIQMKALKKMRSRVDNTPYYDGVGVLLMDSKNPVEKIPAKILKTTMRSRREVITSIACPLCDNPMFWDKAWEAFKCKNLEAHGGRSKIYEVVRE
jgi:hypothetical protein